MILFVLWPTNDRLRSERPSGPRDAFSFLGQAPWSSPQSDVCRNLTPVRTDGGRAGNGGSTREGGKRRGVERIRKGEKRAKEGLLIKAADRPSAFIQKLQRCKTHLGDTNSQPFQ